MADRKLDRRYEVGQNKDGKLVRWECGWNGNEPVSMQDIVDVAAREFPGVPFGDLRISIADESYVVLYQPVKELEVVESRPVM